jgi:hypothetical protein
MRALRRHLPHNPGFWIALAFVAGCMLGDAGFGWA